MAEEKSNLNKFRRFAGVGVQMGVSIAGFAFLGSWLDEGSEGKPVWTITLSLLGVFIGLYLVIKEVIKMSKDD